MRTSPSNRPLSPKISIKQFRLTGNQSPNHPLNLNYNYPHSNLQQFNKNQSTKRSQYDQQKAKNYYNYRYPESHISSQRSVQCEEMFPISQEQVLPQNRSRRRKIFQKKTLRARVIPDQYTYDIEARNNSKQKQLSQQKYGEKQQSSYFTVKQHQVPQQFTKKQEFVTLKNLQVCKEETNRDNNHFKNQSSPKQCHQLSENQLQSSPWKIKQPINSDFQSRQSLNNRTYENYSRNQDSNRYNQRRNSPNNEQFIKNINLSNEKLPSFANNSHNNEIQTQKNLKNKSMQLQTMIILSGLPQEVKKLKKQIRDQRRQLSELDQKIQSSNSNHFRKQKQLLQDLISQHQQLTNKQYELNESLQKMSRIQSENGQRYEKMLKYELQMQRAQRIQNLCRQNQRLAQELLKNHSQDTADLTPLSLPLNINNTKINSQSYRCKKLFTRTSYPINSFTYPDKLNLSKNTNTNKYFREEYYEKNWRQISALEATNKCQQSYDNDNTLRQLLSPLEVKHQFDL